MCNKCCNLFYCIIYFILLHMSFFIALTAFDCSAYVVTLVATDWVISSKYKRITQHLQSTFKVSRIRTIMPSSRHQHSQDKIVLSCLFDGVNRIGHKPRLKTVFSSPRRISRLNKTVSKFSVADSLNLSPIICLHRRHRQDETRQSFLVRVRVGGVN